MACTSSRHRIQKFFTTRQFKLARLYHNIGNARDASGRLAGTCRPHHGSWGLYHLDPRANLKQSANELVSCMAPLDSRLFCSCFQVNLSRRSFTSKGIRYRSKSLLFPVERTAGSQVPSARPRASGGSIIAIKLYITTLGLYRESLKSLRASPASTC